MGDVIGFALSAAVAFGVGAALQAWFDRRHRAQMIDEVIATESAAHRQRNAPPTGGAAKNSRHDAPDRDVESTHG